MLRLTSAVGRNLVRNHLNLQRATLYQQSRRRQGQQAANPPNEAPSDDKKGQGLTPDNPFLVASPSSKCIVGCSCTPESHLINWFYVTEGEPQTCNCDCYFKLVKVDPKTDYVPEYSRVMHVDSRRTDIRLRQGDSFLKRLFRKKKAVGPTSMGKKTAEDKTTKS